MQRPAVMQARHPEHWHTLALHLVSLTFWGSPQALQVALEGMPAAEAQGSDLWPV